MTAKDKVVEILKGFKPDAPIITKAKDGTVTCTAGQMLDEIERDTPLAQQLIAHLEWIRKANPGGF